MISIWLEVVSSLCNSDHNILDINCERCNIRTATNNVEYNFNKGNSRGNSKVTKLTIKPVHINNSIDYF